MEAKSSSTGHVPSPCSVPSPVYQQPSLEGRHLKKVLSKSPLQGRGLVGFMGGTATYVSVRRCVGASVCARESKCVSVSVHVCMRVHGSAHMYVCVSACAWECARV